MFCDDESSVVVGVYCLKVFFDGKIYLGVGNIYLKCKGYCFYVFIVYYIFVIKEKEYRNLIFLRV